MFKRIQRRLIVIASRNGKNENVTGIPAYMNRTPTKTETMKQSSEEKNIDPICFLCVLGLVKDKRMCYEIYDCYTIIISLSFIGLSCNLSTTSALFYITMGSPILSAGP